MKSYFSIFVFLFGFSALAAPAPATSSSILISEKPGLFRSSHGFQLHAADTSWYLQPTNTNSEHLETIYKSPKLLKGLQASLTVRVDQKKSNVSFQQYLRRSLKDYTRLGMDVLKAKPVKLNGLNGFLVDALSRDKEKQLRQLIFGRGNTLVILTCRDHQSHFQNSVKECNEIMKSFSWL